MPEMDEFTTTISPGGIELPLELCVPEGATHLLLSCYAFGLGFEEWSDNGRAINRGIHERGVATLEFSLLTDNEKELVENWFDWELLTSRLLAITEWAQNRDETEDLTMGYFATSSGTAPVLRATARTDAVSGIVARGGRLDFAPDALEEIDVPVYLFVGAEDEPVRTINEEIDEELGDQSDLYVVEGVGHRFGEGYNDTVSEKTVEWFSEI